ncbi:MAG: hypothetical protein ACK523_02755 [Pirellulaceae bacterium]
MKKALRYRVSFLEDGPNLLTVSLYQWTHRPLRGRSRVDDWQQSLAVVS